MAKARVCDRCGITVTTDYVYDFRTFKVDVQNSNCYETRDIKDFELCTDCMKKLKKFIGTE